MHVSSFEFESKYGPFHQLSMLKCDFRSFCLRFTHAKCLFLPFLNSVYHNIVHFKKLLFPPFCLNFSCCLSFQFCVSLLFSCILLRVFHFLFLPIDFFRNTRVFVSCMLIVSHNLLHLYIKA